MDEIWKAVRGVIASVAPALAAALGGPVAGLAVQAIATAVLGRPDAAPAEVATALASATPEQLAALRRADQEFAVKLRELANDLERVAAADRANAREMARDDRWTPRILAFCVLAAWVGLNAAVFAKGLPSGAAELLSRALGGLDALLLMVFGFYFGSSAGSQDKTSALAAAARR